MKKRVKTPITIKPVAEDNFKTELNRYKKKAASSTPQKLKKFAAAIILPLFLSGLDICFVVSLVVIERFICLRCACCICSKY